MDIEDVRRVAFGGGGVRGVCYLGILAVIDEAWRDRGGLVGWSARLEVCAGTSIGCLFALMLTLELPLSGIAVLLVSNGTIRRSMLPNPTVAALHAYGMDDGAGLRAMAEALLAQRCFSPNITLRELRRCTSKRLVCTACNVVDMRAEYLDANTAPDMRVADAVAASMRVPVVYAPFIDRGRGLVLTDGGGADNFPMGRLADGAAPGEVLGFRTRPSPPARPADIAGGGHWIARAVMCPLAALEQLQLDSLTPAMQLRVVTIDTGTVTGMEFFAGPGVYHTLWAAGASGMSAAIDVPRGPALLMVSAWVVVSMAARRTLKQTRALARAIQRTRLSRHPRPS
jgi:predicted acylesterase/phospholipase RssA